MSVKRRGAYRNRDLTHALAGATNPAAALGTQRKSAAIAALAGQRSRVRPAGSRGQNSQQPEW